jgi:hypothetical protein
LFWDFDIEPDFADFGKDLNVSKAMRTSKYITQRERQKEDETPKDREKQELKQTNEIPEDRVAYKREGNQSKQVLD